MAKAGKLIHVKAKSPWKQLSIPKSVFDESAFDGLVDVLELKSYEFIRVDKKKSPKKRKATDQPESSGSKEKKMKVQNQDKSDVKEKKRKKKRKKKNMTEETNNDSFTDSNQVIDMNSLLVENNFQEQEGESDENTSYKQKAKKNNKRKKKNQVVEVIDEEAVQKDGANSKTKKGKKRKKNSQTEFCDISQNIGHDESVSQTDVNKKKSKSKKGAKQKNPSKKSVLQTEESTLVDEEAVADRSSKIDMSNWVNLFVPDVLLRSLRDQKFANPTTIQVLSLPTAIRDHKDILAAAETGSGKTLAFGIPVVANILSHKERLEQQKHHDDDDDDDDDINGDEVEDDESDVVADDSDAAAGDSDAAGDDSDDTKDKSDDDDDGSGEDYDYINGDIENEDETPEKENPPMALILEPTRELAVQVYKHLMRLAKHTNIKFAIVVGGMSVEKQRRILKRCPEIIIATPGRLWQLIEEGDPHLRQVDLIHSLVVDEADRMVEKGHYEELTKLLHLINTSPRRDEDRQSFVMSATLTMEIDLPTRVLNKAKKEKVSEKDKLKMLTKRICLGTKPKIIDLTPKDKVAQSLSEMRVNCNAQEKDYYLYYFLTQHTGRTLVFANSKDCLRRLVSIFTLLECSPYPLHADMQQRQRLKNLDRFSTNSKGLLLASDVAARGLDIPNVDYVIHYQVPQTMENYVHRSGRTARASNVGLSVMLVAPEDARNYRKIVHGVKNGEELPLLPINLDILPAIKSRVQLARTIDVAEHRMKKIRLHNDFFSKAAEDMDMILDDQNLIPETDDSVTEAEEKKQIKQMKYELSSILKGSIAPLRMTKYPTKSGKLLSMKSVDLFNAT